MKFSVVIPIYNVQAFLRECLDSVIAAAARAQGEVECLCVDDGSTDDSPSILDEYAAGHCWIKALHQGNQGVAASRNAALQIARGEWLLFVDADDLLRADVFEILLEGIGRYPSADMLGYGILPFYTSTCGWTRDSVEWHDAGIASRIGDELSAMSFCQFAYRRSVHGEARFERLTVGEDLVFSARAFSRSRGCWITNAGLYGYRFRPDSATHCPMTVAKLLDVPRFNVLAFSALEESGKSVGGNFSRGRGNEWIAGFPCELLRHRGEPQFARVWCAWYDSLALASRLKCFSAKQRWIATTVNRHRSRVLVFLLCRLLRWLARRGFLWG